MRTSPEVTHRYEKVAPVLSRAELLPLSSGIGEPFFTSSSDAFLGRFELEGIAEELDLHSVLADLAERGYQSVSLRAGTRDARSWFQLFADVEQTELLLELVLWREYLVPELPLVRGVDAPFRCLTMEWLRLRDPCASFSPEFPRLPGQDVPGLHVARRVLGLVESWGARIGADLIMALPDYFHSAIMYHRGGFRFLDPEMLGLYRALRRDLCVRDRAAASRRSWEFEWGMVRREGAIWFWPTEILIIPKCELLREYLDSPGYEAEATSAAATRFSLSGDAAARWPDAGLALLPGAGST